MFIAASEEKDLSHNHDITPNGYNLGRDWLVGNATSQDQVIPTVIDGPNGTRIPGVDGLTRYSGSVTYKNWTYKTDVEYARGYLKNSNGA